MMNRTELKSENDRRIIMMLKNIDTIKRRITIIDGYLNWEMKQTWPNSEYILWLKQLRKEWATKLD